MPKTGRPPVIAAQHYPLPTRLAHAHPYSSQAELAQAFHAETGITAHPDTFAKALKLAGIVRARSEPKAASKLDSRIVPRTAHARRRSILRASASASDEAGRGHRAMHATRKC